MFLREDARHIGNIKLGPINRHHGTGDIGLLIGERSEWGKGHACEAIALFADYAFANLGLAKLTASCYSDNEGSRHAFLKAGFVEEGRRLAQYMSCGKRQDGVMLGRVNPGIKYHTK
jgi:RimJ/RimL family protein N-acetyltransferase